LVAAWIRTLTQVIKAKTVLSPEVSRASGTLPHPDTNVTQAMQNVSLTLNDVEDGLPSMDKALIESSGLGECIRQLSRLGVEQIAREDEFGLVMRARDLAGTLTA